MCALLHLLLHFLYNTTVPWWLQHKLYYLKKNAYIFRVFFFFSFFWSKNMGNIFYKKHWEYSIWNGNLQN